MSNKNSEAKGRCTSKKNSNRIIKKFWPVVSISSLMGGAKGYDRFQCVDVIVHCV